MIFAFIFYFLLLRFFIVSFIFLFCWSFVTYRKVLLYSAFKIKYPKECNKPNYWICWCSEKRKNILNWEISDWKSEKYYGEKTRNHHRIILSVYILFVRNCLKLVHISKLNFYFKKHKQQLPALSIYQTTSILVSNCNQFSHDTQSIQSTCLKKDVQTSESCLFYCITMKYRFSRVILMNFKFRQYNFWECFDEN